MTTALNIMTVGAQALLIGLPGGILYVVTRPHGRHRARRKWKGFAF
jgi:hypothetical protein